ncbi:MAG: Xaa-Pro aminopeptidase [Gammaproteobacteria bacterium]|nr:Xaa-Pro aminopeptidase [Gammaproteobacteria bacterium]
MQDYAARRQRVLDYIGNDGIAFISAATEIERAGDTTYYFRQNSNFYYLTGFTEPEAILVLAPGYAEGEFLLFNRPRDPLMEIWNGRRIGQEGACTELGADKAYLFDDFYSHLPELLVNRKRVYYPIGHDPVADELLIDAINTLRSKVRSGVTVPEEFHNIEPFIHEMRLRKSPEEVALMRKAADASVAGHKRAMQVCRPGLFEYELEAELLYEFYRHGCRAPAYSSIIGGGENACILHYTTNDHRLNDGDLVLMDAGGEYDYYAADITRTIPVNGRFSEPQKQIYELVLKSQLAAIDMIRPGLPFFDIQREIQRILTEGLIGLGILEGELDVLLKEQAIKRFYMHNSGHWLGLDTHDAGAYKINQAWRPLEVGFVLTVEPGLYISANSEGVDPKWWNIGVRIEDDVLVTEAGADVLTKDLPKRVADIEALMEKN